MTPVRWPTALRSSAAADGSESRPSPSEGSQGALVGRPSRLPRSVSPFWPLATPIGVSRVECVFLAGVPVKSSVVRELATRVKDPELAHRLEQVVKRDLIVVRIHAHERADLLKALDDAPAGLEAVRDALVEAQARQKRDEPAAENAA